MRIELENKNKQHNDEITPTDDLAALIKDQSGDEKKRFSDLPRGKKAEFIWYYYKWWIIGGIAAIIAITIFIRDWRENSKPVYLNVEMMNTFFSYDKTNTLYDDYVRASGVDLDSEQIIIDTETTLATDNYDTTMIAFQQRLFANYSAQELDVVIGPKKIIEGPANCDCYADLDTVLPKDLVDELKDRGYELYYYDPSTAATEDDEPEDGDPYFAGIYLDNCSYLNNMGENGAYPEAETEEDRPVFTIAANSLRTDHAIEFLRFLTL